MAGFIHYLCATLGEGPDPRVKARLGLAAASYANEQKLPLKTMKAAAAIAAARNDSLVRIEFVKAAESGSTDVKATADAAQSDRRRLARIRRADRIEAAAKAKARAAAKRKRDREAKAKAKADA